MTGSKQHPTPSSGVAEHEPPRSTTPSLQPSFSSDDDDAGGSERSTRRRKSSTNSSSNKRNSSCRFDSRWVFSIIIILILSAYIYHFDGIPIIHNMVEDYFSKNLWMGNNDSRSVSSIYHKNVYWQQSATSSDKSSTSVSTSGSISGSTDSSTDSSNTVRDEFTSQNVNFKFYHYNCTGDHSVQSLPGYGPVNKDDALLYSYAGHISIYREDTNKDRKGAMFYWFFGRTSQDESKRPILLWLQGGPSASSMIGAFEEYISPFYIQNLTENQGLTLHYNNQSWISYCDLLFIDQPVGTGFGYAESEKDYATTRHQVSNDLYSVLLNFFDKYPQFRERDLIFSGESYAGKYLPSLGERVYLIQNHRIADSAQHLPYPKIQHHNIHKRLLGIIIGDGFTAPIVQRVLKADQAYWSGLLGYQQRQQLKTLQRECIRHIQTGNTVESGSACEDVKSYLLIASGVINIYDIRTFAPSTDKIRLEAYLNQPEVKKAIHILDESCSNKPDDIHFVPSRLNPVYDKLRADIFVDLRDLIPLLAEKTKVLLYGGNFDLQDGPQPIERFLLTMSEYYPIMHKWKESPRNLLFVNNKVAGYEKSFGNFSFVTIFGNGHFVHNQRESMRELLRRFIEQTSSTHLSFCSKDESIPVRFKTLTPSTFLKYLYDNKTNDHRIPCQSQQLICETILKNCNGHGICNHGYCTCNKGYIGETCENTVKTIPVGYETDPNDPIVLKQQEIYYGGIHLQNLMAITTIQVDWRPKLRKKEGQPLNAFDYKYDTVSKPTSKLCLFTKRGDIPTIDNYDKAHCKENYFDGPLLVVSNSTASEEKKGKLYFGLFNTMHYEVECELKVLTWNQEYSIFLLDETAANLIKERDFMVGLSALLILILLALVISIMFK
ncbi:hypothetical protein FDP41_000229 [Naegleria fowleri]|uniref:EGF-like domain-containing protein n=1 Tax=Naegleria fowleri TaxID=5763 RepID=A0A6A5CI80_NAEFO|nr:uncharacterized protein FDP41_000229 [Naegleria fowleri]KAF0985190.1 hypothetical protein FDP41_000229 [Naegleria fowleri]CAG4714254.1 unnamed protein product [Naegleria fowleri]